MRSIVFDEISNIDMLKIRNILKQNIEEIGLPDVFWLTIPDNLLTNTQYKHSDCKPHGTTITLEDNKLILIELLIRNRANLHCNCNTYCTKEQIIFILNWIETLIYKLNIKT